MTSTVVEVWLMYRIREVDGSDEDVAETLADLHRLTFFDSAPLPDFERGHWWLAYHDASPVGFAGVVSSTHAPNAGYFCRVGVVGRHQGQGASAANDAGNGSAGAAQRLEFGRF